MLACARLGAVHSVVFAGFSADSLAQRCIDCQCALPRAAGLNAYLGLQLEQVALQEE